jgi:hypothetical protein
MYLNPLPSRWVAVATLTCAGAALAQPDPNYVAPKGGYDTPGQIIKVLGAVGETYERKLGEPQTSVYQRSIRLKMIGLENLSRLSALKAQVNQADDKEQKRQAASSDGKGGLLGGLMSAINPMLAKEVDRQKDDAKDELVVQVVEAGSPADTANAAVVDIVGPPDQVTGSFFGAKINNKVRVKVTADDFNPRVLILRYKPKGAMTPLQGDPTPSFNVVANVDTEGNGANEVTATYDRTTVTTDGSRGLYIAVTSEDGKAVSGKYKIRYYPQ